ncbi:MAG: hypothetical protein JXA13_04050 [Anaerolineales bacterium]|nr:hypothetical protein [Anaerolineales bacterium]
MTNVPFSLPEDYWKAFQVTAQDINFINNHLFELETPLTVSELLEVLVTERIRIEKETQLEERQGGGQIYLPKENYSKGDTLVFPALSWSKAKVEDVRPGFNPDVGEFEVLTVTMEDGEERLFSAGLLEHKLNQVSENPPGDEAFNLKSILEAIGPAPEEKLNAAMEEDENSVCIAGRWFPRPLLMDINMGHLNLAEAVLDVASGEPLAASELLKEIGFLDEANSKLAEFSLNYALQEDERFDEVGPAGQVLWCLKRLEPEGVQQTPAYLKYEPIAYDRSLITEEMKTLERQLGDELSDVDSAAVDEEAVVVKLIYPHWRVGSLPLSKDVRPFFPTAYETSRIRFTLIDGDTGEHMPGWVVRDQHYVFGLREWYEAKELIPGGLISIRHGDTPGEVVVTAISTRTYRDWMRTALVGTDEVLVFALLKQVVSVDFNERMAVAIPDVDAIDQIWEKLNKKKQPLEKIVLTLMQELTKLNPQGHVHAEELYSAVNIIRRCPPGPLFSILAANPDVIHVGDLHFRLKDNNPGDV